MLEKSLQSPRAVPPWTREQWQSKLERVSGYRRPAAAGAAENQTAGESAADCPRLVRRRAETGAVRLPQPADRADIRQPGVSVPDIGELLNYDADNVQYRYKPQAQSLRLLIPRLHLWLASE
jgi:DNA replication terminus site-binding protein